ncbi:hypothetical protein [Acidovorax sp. NCPPB 4044]|uniref:hypothetical protein n=1 Tax=Acidovorax sp. NCPPB 4044 TaxID=2940490 RepID=UPI002302CD01|nr:hypothetical protein [Acidovorax sp. NCPPB 4044]MDA8522927.1 hypothetical protein [Acidovorax sp. NCPPB 4044]
MEPSATSLRIAAFPKGKDIWRIDWFGPIAFPDRLTRRRHPSVLVYLSKVVAPSPLENTSVLLQPDSTQPSGHQVKRWVSVGTTLLLRIGDLWQDQTLVARPTYEEAAFENITIDRDHVSLVKAGLSFDDGKFLLPLAQHPWHINNTHSYCVRVALPDDRFMVVPCMELVRFYLGSSSELISRLFAPPLARNSLHGKVYISQRGRMSLELAERIPKASAEDVARIAGSDAAWRAAALVSSSCLKASTAGRDIYPQAVFPFEGVTTLQAVGKWLPQGEAEQGTFLVYQLRSCSHPLPFQSLHYRQNRGISQALAKNSSDTPKAQGARPQRTAAQSKTSTLQEHDASSTLAPATRAVTGRRRFPDLDHKFIQAERQTPSASPPPATHAGSAQSVPDMAVGQPGSQQRIRPVSLVDVRARAQADAPNFLRLVISAMEEIDGMEMRLLQAQDQDAWTMPPALLADDDGVIRDQVLFYDHGRRTKPRRIASIVASKDGVHAALTIAEGNTPVLQFNRLTIAEALDPTPRCLRLARRFNYGGSQESTFVLDSPGGAKHLKDWLLFRFTGLIQKQTICTSKASD